MKTTQIPAPVSLSATACEPLPSQLAPVTRGNNKAHVALRLHTGHGPGLGDFLLAPHSLTYCRQAKGKVTTHGRLSLLTWFSNHNELDPQRWKPVCVPTAWPPCLLLAPSVMWPPCCQPCVPHLVPTSLPCPHSSLLSFATVSSLKVPHL